MFVVQPSADPNWSFLDVLSEQRRRSLYEVVRAADHPLTRDEVAASAGIPRELAAFHLDKLAAAGLLDTSYARPPGRGGPGAGRPAKRYQAAPIDLEMTIPPRRYALVGRILAAAVAGAGRSSARTRAHELATAEGVRIGREHRPPAGSTTSRTRAAVRRALTVVGYEPRVDGRSFVLHNCPFHELAQHERELVCSMNESLVGGVVSGVGADDLMHPELDPEDGRCCVVVRDGAGPTTRRRAR